MTSTWAKAYKNLSASFIKSRNKPMLSEVLSFYDFVHSTQKRGGTMYLIAEGRSMDVLQMWRWRAGQPPIALKIQPLTLASKGKIKERDSALICTGTGFTWDVLSNSRLWLRINKHIGLITSQAAKDFPASIFSVMPSDAVCILLPGITKNDVQRRKDNPKEIQTPLTELYPDGETYLPSPTIFEIATLAFLESVTKQLLDNCP